MEKHTITRIFRNTEDKAGNPLVTKDGRAYTKVSIQVEDMPDEWIGGFGHYTNEKWKEGDVVEIIVEEKEWQGKTYLNFKTPNKMTELGDRMSALEKRVAILEGSGKIVDTAKTIFDAEEAPF